MLIYSINLSQRSREPIGGKAQSLKLFCRRVCRSSRESIPIRFSLYPFSSLFLATRSRAFLIFHFAFSSFLTSSYSVHGFFSVWIFFFQSPRVSTRRDKLYNIHRDFLFFLVGNRRTGFVCYKSFVSFLALAGVSWGLAYSEVLLPFFKKKKKEWSLMLLL